MNIQQLEYIIAVDKFRHFAKAAEFCNVTQPTLSMMIQKLEEELDVKIFDRSKHPVRPTVIGRQIIERAHTSLKHFRQIKEMVDNEHGIVSGTFRLGIIPTIASYLVPSILHKHSAGYSQIDLVMRESTTGNMVHEVADGVLDGGILAGPLNIPGLIEYPLYYEKFYAYVSPLEDVYSEREIDLDTIDINALWLLENEHCLRGQIEQLCRLKKKSLQREANAIRYEAGSIDTLINVVDSNTGITVIPEMHAMGLSEEKQENLRAFKNFTAVREVCLVVNSEYGRKTMLNLIIEIIKDAVPKSMQDPKLKEYVIGIVRK